LRSDLSLALRLVVVIGIPASAGLILVAAPLTQAVLQHGEFGAGDAERTAAMISAYALGVWAYCGIPILFRGFYALGDRAAPLRVGLLAVMLDTALNLTLIWPLGERGLALSTAISATGQFAALCWLLQRRIGTLDWGRMAPTTVKTLTATAVMAAVCLAAQRWQPNWREVLATIAPDGAHWPRLLSDLLALAVPVGLAGLAYLGAAWAGSLTEIWLLLRRGAGSRPDAATDGVPLTMP
jgi:putative peptidoglycan lipid II flippase